MARPSRYPIALLAALGALALVPASASAATITVNSTADTQANDGTCTLREAIVAANGNAASGGADNECAAGQASPTEDRIEFAISGAAPHVIAPAVGLPDVTEVVTIDGSTDDTDEIALNGAPGNVAFGLRLAGGSTAESLSIYGFGTGVLLTSPNGSVLNSFIGTSEAGAAGLGNGDGIGMSSSDGTVRGNVISGNDNDGVRVFSTGNVLAGNRIGTTPGGTAALANGGDGVTITESADDVTIGGPALADMNLISGNGATGINAAETTLVGTGITGITIEGNRIGTRVAGENAQGNAAEGILLTGNVTGTAITDNLISGNGQEGIELRVNVVQPDGAPGPSDTTIAGNLIGTDDDGESTLANSAGISISGNDANPAADNVIGGPSGLTVGGACTGDCNVISGNGGTGITSIETTDGLEVLGNHIGADVTGAVDLGNGSDAIELNGSDGGTIGSPAAPNVLSGNDGAGVTVFGLTATGNEIRANRIGVSSSGTAALGNDDRGIWLLGAGTGNIIGGLGAGEGNVIANNGTSTDPGVQITAGSTDEAVVGNSIHSNAGLGIDLHTVGVTANDAGDADAGDNDQQNFPVIEAAIADVGTVVRGTLGSTANSDFRIEVFANTNPDVSGYGEGQTLLGSLNVTTDGTGTADFSAVLPGVAGGGQAITATATQLNPPGAPLSTSEFGPNLSEGVCDVLGTPGDDPAVQGTTADELLCGLAGDDSMDGGGGDDAFLGGEGTDELDYSSATGGVVVDLLTGTASGAGAGSDLLLSLEDVAGSDFDDEITANDEDNKLKGLDGKDTLLSKDGKDKLRGGDGGDDLDGGKGDKDDLDGDDGKDSFDGGKGDKDDCDGGPDKDRKPAKGCEKKKSIP